MKTVTTNLKMITIDAAGRALGRVASQAAVTLRGKNDPNFVRHLTPKTKVTIINAAKLKISPVKMRDKTYSRYTGYPGGLRQPSLAQVIAKKGYAEPLRHAIKGMLANNKLRPIMMTNLTITE